MANLFKFEYNWFEGEHEETFLGKDVSHEEFEKDLVEAREFAKILLGKKIDGGDYLGKGYSVECLPEYYRQLIWFLTEKKGYIEYKFYDNVSYSIDDYATNDKIEITKSAANVNHKTL